MKKTLFAFTAIAAALVLAGCASTKTAEPAVFVAPENALAECGAWDEAKKNYTVDLSMTNPNDSEITVNGDKSITVTFPGNYSSIVIPMPAADEYFMKNVTKLSLTFSSKQDIQKKLAWKLANDLTKAWDKGGGLLGQGDHCVGFMFRDYEDPWDNTVVDLYFNGDDTSFDKLTAKMYKGLVSIAMCNNTTKAPFTFTIKSAVFSVE